MPLVTFGSALSVPFIIIIIVIVIVIVIVISSHFGSIIFAEQLWRPSTNTDKN